MESIAACMLVGVGGFLGAVSRFLLGNVIAKSLGTEFPYPTFLINVVGSLLLGLVAGAVIERALPFSDGVRLAAAVGFLGAFTTFSTFEYETNHLLTTGEWLYSAANVVGSLLLGLIAVRVGLAIGRII